VRSLLGLLAAAVLVTAGAAPANAASENGCDRWGWALRLDFNNIQTNLCDNKSFLPYQEGAQITLTINELAHTRSVNGQGVIAGFVNVFPKNANDPFLGMVIGPYLQGSGTYQFASSKTPITRSDLVTEGGFAQVGFENPLPGNYLLQNYFRFRGGDVESNTGTNSTTFVGEWLPAANFSHDAPAGDPSGCYFAIGEAAPLRCGTFETSDQHIFFLLTPELMVQSDHLDSGPNKYRLFSRNDSALRIGPQISLALYPYNEGPVLDNFSLSTVYHVSTDTDSGRGYAWVLTTLTYNLPSSDPRIPTFGLTASYGAGNSETTANTTSQFMIGLSVKH
jgi:hypothetical protein